MHAPEAPKAILLDALGTLVELEPPAPRLRRELANRFAIAVTDAQAERAIEAEFAYYRAHLDEGRDARSLADLRGRCAEALRTALPKTSTVPHVANTALTEALLASLRFRAYPEVRGVLVAARARGRRLAVVSNWDVSLHDVLARMELTPLLDGVVTSAQVGARKPSPEIFAAALRVVRAEPGETLHVGDSVNEDVSGARQAGIEPVLISRDGTAGAPGVRTITTLTEL
jgi:putative hydrolase of the HAD superfamily